MTSEEGTSHCLVGQGRNVSHHLKIKSYSSSHFSTLLTATTHPHVMQLSSPLSELFSGQVTEIYVAVTGVQVQGPKTVQTIPNLKAQGAPFLEDSVWPGLPHHSGLKLILHSTRKETSSSQGIFTLFHLILTTTL